MPDNQPDWSVAIIGYGTMGQGIVSAYTRAGLPSTHITLVSPHVNHTLPYQTYNTIAAYQVACEQVADAIILCVKPDKIEAVCHELQGYVGDETRILSIAAGKNVASIAAYFSQAQPVFRLMPNLALRVGKGVCGVYPRPDMTRDNVAAALRVIQPLGVPVLLDDEEQMHALTALSGSGPAYYFEICHEMANKAVAMGLSREQADILARETFIGAAAMLDAAGEETCESLLDQIAVPAGTTQAGIDALRDGGVADTIEACLRSAARRSRELAK